ncbi:MAG TPA: hypothetical protein VHZ30_06100 [Verrucomicrobiae bacterium]|nr:hypothetical protein [Verrucomicrobiae bacterium]
MSLLPEKQFQPTRLKEEDRVSGLFPRLDLVGILPYTSICGDNHPFGLLCQFCHP